MTAKQIGVEQAKKDERLGRMSPERLREICAFAAGFGDPLACEHYGLSAVTLDRYKRHFKNNVDKSAALRLESLSEIARKYDPATLTQLGIATPPPAV